ncbi:M20 family metallopeptidase [candidate division KSB1 bacterium]
MDLKTGILNFLTANRRNIYGLAEEIHKNPELSGREHGACERLSRELESGGFEVTRGVEGLPTAFLAELPNPKSGSGPSIAFLAEYDALPEMGHACGHNLIGTASVYAGLALAGLADRPAGRVIVIGTPAEETSGAKIDMLAKGVFDRVDFALMFHPASVTCVNVRSFANMPFEVTFRGRSSHAAASPERGINALDAMISLFVNLGLARKHLPDQVRIPGIITHGGVRPNIVPDKTVGRFSLRANDLPRLEQVIEVFRRCVRSSAGAHGARFRIRQYESSYREMRSNGPLAESFAANLERVGIEVDVAENDRRGSIDMGSVSQKIPAIHPTLRLGDGSVSTHTAKFAELTGSQDGFETARLAAATLAMTGLDLLLDDGLRKRAAADFRQAERAVEL